MTGKWITAPQYALKYGLHRRTVLRWIKEKRVVAVMRADIYLVQDPGILEVANAKSRVHKEADLAPCYRGAEVAKALGITPRALRLYSEGGKMGYTTIGGKRRYTISDIRQIIARRQLKTTRKTNREETSRAMVAHIKEQLELE